MFVCCRIEEEVLRRNLASEMGSPPQDLESVTDLVVRIRVIGPESDEWLRRLMSWDSVGPGFVSEVVVAAAHPLLHRRCASNPALSVDDLATELALVVGRVMREGLPPSSRHVLNVLLDMAWGQYRKPFRRARVPVVDVDRVEHLLMSRERVPEDVLDGVVLSSFREQLAADPWGQRAMVRCWNSALELGSKPSRTRLERYRLKYARSQLRRVAPPDLVA